MAASRLPASVAVFLALATAALGQTTEIQYLSGTGSDDTVPWEFRVSGGRRSGAWTTIPVPSNWEMQGFGTYRYGDDWSRDPAPDSVGSYRHRFSIPAHWQGKHVELVFGGSMTDTEVTLNGRPAGPTHQGGFYQFRYSVTDLVRPGGENLLEVKVRRYSSDPSVNRAERSADYWLFGGIFRPVWLEAAPMQRIERIAVDARHTGAIRVNVTLDGVTSADRVTGQVRTLDDVLVGPPFTAPVAPDSEEVTLRAHVPGVQPWSAEWPHRYRVVVRLESGDGVVHEIGQPFGFRTVEVRQGDGLYVNGSRVRIRGVNRHSFWPTTGRTTNRGVSIGDIELMKAMNMNAVRMSHYPPDPHFLDVADSLGLYVIDELAGWQDAYDTRPGEPLVRELVLRDVNHPSVILWSNGNEGGWNTDLDDDFARWDPQDRTVIHPWLNFNGIDASHYEPWDCCATTFFHGTDLIMPTEFLHGLYDGGHGAGLDDWWSLLLRHPLGVGGFLWAFADEGIVRQDQGGRIDVTGNRAPDGIVGPYREKEGSFYAIREIWSPVYLPLGELDRLPPGFDGTIRVDNRYDFTDLEGVVFTWRLLDFPSPDAATTEPLIAAEGSARTAAPPRQSGALSIQLPGTWTENDAFSLTATDPHGRELYTWTWMIQTPAAVVERLISAAPGRATGVERDGVIAMAAAGTRMEIDASTGWLLGAARGGSPVPLRNGPRPVSGDARLTGISHGPDGPDYVVEAEFEGDLQSVVWRLNPGGWLRLDYALRIPTQTTFDYLGVTFDYPEADVRGIRWLGKGPYRVWKNRRKGAEFGVWEKPYNDAITGYRWDYPEFKGFHEDVYWATLGTSGVPITMLIATEGLFLRLFTPGEGPDPRTTHVDFPPGDLSLLHAIAPVGTKFHPASDHGPGGAPNLGPRLGGPTHATLFFHFGT